VTAPELPPIDLVTAPEIPGGGLSPYTLLCPNVQSGRRQVGGRSGPPGVSLTVCERECESQEREGSQHPSVLSCCHPLS
jgi:hypothetical protein